MQGRNQMPILNRLFYFLNAVYGLMVLSFILDVFGIVEVKGQKLDSFVNFGTLIFTPIIIVCNLIVFKIKRLTLWLCIPSAFLIVCFITIVSRFDFLAYLFSIGSYQTQTILYENAYCECKTIEFQIQDVGALGYNERFVEVTCLTPWFMITNEIDPEQKKGQSGLKWIRR